MTFKNALTIFLLVSNIVIGQTNLIESKINENGTLEFTSVIEFPNKTAPELYKLTSDWVAFTFKNTESVSQSQVENKMIRINGISPSAIGPFMSYYFDLEYDIQVDIKDGKIRFKAYNLKQVAQTSPFTKTGLEAMFKKTGELKSGKKYLKVKSQVDTALSSLSKSLKDKIEGKADSDSDDW